jgi:chromosome segregation protein
MRIEKLELNGFKSFAERTTFNLHPGVTCIVGPNGCGKSNVVDAFRWVLGEQSAKSLRGGSMQEVIFAGSSTKKPKGMSEVVLTVSGLGAQGNGKETTTAVARRLYRSGESDYLLNRESCRLRDIRDLFLDTGLEMKSYSILEQDRISAILAARPEERRFLIEEVAGVVKYRIRRTEAINKLDSSRQNLVRIADITAEIKRQIATLDRQARKAERYKALMAELRDVELRLARAEHLTLRTALDEILRELSSHREQDALLRAELGQKEADIEARRIALAEKDRALEGTKRELQGIEREMAELERTLAVVRTERTNLGEYAQRLGFDREETRRKREEAGARKQEVVYAVEALRQESSGVQARMGEREEVLRSVEAEIRLAEGGVSTREREAMRLSDHASTLRGEAARLTASVEALEAKREALQRDEQETAVMRDDSESALKTVEAAMLQRTNRVLVLKDECRGLGDEVEGVKRRIEDLRQETARVREAQASQASRLESLREMALEETGSAALEGIDLLSSIADLVRVPKEYERAVESALGEVIRGHVVAGVDDVRRAIGIVRRADLSRTTFMPLNDPRRAYEGRDLPAGALAWAADVVTSTEERFADTVRALLGGIAIARDLDAALAMEGAPGPVATLEGEVLAGSGAVTAGKSRGILTMKRQIRELALEVERLSRRVEALGAEASERAALLKEKGDALARLEHEMRENEREAGLLRVRAERHHEDMERANRKLNHLRTERGEVLSRRESAVEAAGTKERESEDLAGRIAAARAEVEEMKADLSRRKAAHENTRAEAVELRLSLNSCTERINSLKAEGVSIERLMSELAGKDEMIERELVETARKVAQMADQDSAKEEALRGLAVRAGELNARIQDERSRITGETDDLMEQDRALRGLRRRIDETAQAAADLDVRRAEHALRLRTLAEGVRATYDVAIETFEAPPTPDATPAGGLEEDGALREDLRQKIERLGPVSLASIEEYEELKGRFDFQVRQQEDLEKSIAELEEAITRINSTTRKLLREAYEALNAKFGEVFTNLFGGGRAELRLTEEGNILESGIEIVSQPPGKRAQSITLLSGGEKTLTALALLFASFLIKPTPLCILDEADAALDESNTVKFAELIRSLAGDIQFIVVTHNRVTMEAADYIYGITMEEPGSSKAISLQMTVATIAGGEAQAAPSAT